MSPGLEQGCGALVLCCRGSFHSLRKGDFGDGIMLGVVPPWFRRSQHRAYLRCRNLTLKDTRAKGTGLVAEGLNLQRA